MGVENGLIENYWKEPYSSLSICDGFVCDNLAKLKYVS